MGVAYRCKTIERKGFEIDLRILNECTTKFPRFTFVDYYNIYPDFEKPYVLEDYFERIHGAKHVDIGGFLKNGIKKGPNKIFDKHHDEIIDMSTGLVVSAHDNFKVSIGFDNETKEEVIK